jgi:hypothetical protein
MPPKTRAARKSRRRNCAISERLMGGRIVPSNNAPNARMTPFQRCYYIQKGCQCCQPAALVPNRPSPRREVLHLLPLEAEHRRALGAVDGLVLFQLCLLQKAWWQWRQVNGSSRTLRIGPLVLTRSGANQENRHGCGRDRANEDYGKQRGPRHNKQAKQHDSPPGAEVKVARTTDSSFFGWRGLKVEG